MGRVNKSECVQTAHLRGSLIGEGDLYVSWRVPRVAGCDFPSFAIGRCELPIQKI